MPSAPLLPRCPPYQDDSGDSSFHLHTSGSSTETSGARTTHGPTSTTWGLRPCWAARAARCYPATLSTQKAGERALPSRRRRRSRLRDWPLGHTTCGGAGREGRGLRQQLQRNRLSDSEAGPAICGGLWWAEVSEKPSEPENTKIPENKNLNGSYYPGCILRKKFDA